MDTIKQTETRTQWICTFYNIEYVRTLIKWPDNKFSITWHLNEEDDYDKKYLYLQEQDLEKLFQYENAKQIIKDYESKFENKESGIKPTNSELECVNEDDVRITFGDDERIIIKQ